jgi:hypothetical protein
VKSFSEFAHQTIKHAQGMLGESAIREWLVKKKIQHAQVDLICKKDGRWILMEIKNQERFKAPPYDGHGLPIWQFEARLEFYKETGVEPWLVIVEPDNLTVAYMASMVDLARLDESMRIVTGSSKRVVFPITEFTKITLASA